MLQIVQRFFQARSVVRIFAICDYGECKNNTETFNIEATTLEELRTRAERTGWHVGTFDDGSYCPKHNITANLE
jgi:hypothetical protein